MRYLRDVGVVESQHINSTAPFVHPHPVDGHPAVDATGMTRDVEVIEAVVVRAAPTLNPGLFWSRLAQVGPAQKGGMAHPALPRGQLTPLMREKGFARVSSTLIPEGLVTLIAPLPLELAKFTGDDSGPEPLTLMAVPAPAVFTHPAEEHTNNVLLTVLVYGCP